ncbi:MAG: aminopeptidase P family protein [Desulfobacter sp.]|nr:MAG: aminopeptidase P family protein [Desulfobacter sp.]
MKDNLFPLDLIPASEISSRIASLKFQMEKAGMDGVFLTHRPDYYYFSGTAQDAWLYLSLDHDPLIFVRRYLPRAVSETRVGHIVPVHSVTDIPDFIKESHGRLPEKMGLAFDLVPVRDFKFFQSLFFGTQFLDATPLVEACRSIKSDYEIQQMEKVANISQEIFNFIHRHLTPGVRETDFSGTIEAFARTLGHSGRIQMRHYRAEGFSFHLMSGASGGLPGALDSPVCGTGVCTAYPFGAGPKVIRENEPVLVDFATMAHGYHMDESRMFVAGEMAATAQGASQAAIDILFHIKDMIKPGASIKQVFSGSEALALKKGYADAYLGIPGLKSRFVGHGIGLELVENPILAKGRTQEFVPGMVFAVEPKFIFKDQFAAGIESVILVTEEGSRFLSRTPNKVFRI